MSDKNVNLMKVFGVLFWVYGACILLWYGMRLYPGEGFAPVRFVGYVVPWLLVGLAAGLAVGWRLHKRSGRRGLAWFMAGLFLLVGAPYAPLFLPRLEATPQYSGVVKVMSFSVMGRNKDYQAIAAVIRAEKPDLFFVQEAGMGALEEYLAGMYGQQQVYWVAGHGGFIAGRYPLAAQASVSKVPKAVAETPYGRITLWTIHAAKALRGNVEQLRQMEKLVEDVAAVSGMRIVAGDLNTTDKNVPYKLINLHLKNAHQQAGWGFGFTFPTRARRLGMVTPFLRIDHIFYSSDMYALTARVLHHSGGSDHLPIVAELGSELY